MKLRNPKSRFDLSVKSSDRVLEVGGGHNPHPRSNVVVDKYVDTNYHRSDNIKFYKNQEFMAADGENLPFKDKEFDYVICNHVLEHVENPQRFLSEQSRVAKKGYLEVPSLIGEHLYPKKSHRWVILEIGGKLVMMEKTKIGFNTSCDFGNLFQEYFPKNSVGFKIMQRTHPNMETVRIEWQDSIECIVNPDDPELVKYFTAPWELERVNEFMPNRSLSSEMWSSTVAFFDILKSVFKSKLMSRVSKRKEVRELRHQESL